MKKEYTSLGLMSGTSMDGVDASIIQSDGESKYKPILDKYFKYPAGIFKDLTKLRDKIKSSKDLKKFSKEVKNIEKEITLFHAKAVKEITKKIKIKVDFIGFHGQTIYHDVREKISKQLGDAKLLSKLTKKTVVYDFRQNDLKNGGQGAPLTPIFHGLIAFKHKLVPPNIFINIGGIANMTYLGCQITGDGGSVGTEWSARDLCLGNCLIDQWIRTHSKKIFDKDGKIALSGKINKAVLTHALNDYYESELFFGLQKKSMDPRDFDLSFARGLSLEDGAATLTEYTADILAKSLEEYSKNFDSKIILTGGGRKNKYLIRRLREKSRYTVLLIDDYGINGDFVESQAFAYLAIRSYLGEPISFPETTGCSKACAGGKIIRAT
tara:strand:+ start:66 stop:1208 length:1143 start_codon:yes stop_codon:yes gene_type:complete